MNFWPSCGFDHRQRDAHGWLTVTPGHIRLFLDRPELALVPESCKAERRVHQALREDPLRSVRADELARFKDADARDNYRLFLAFRDALRSCGTLEAYYLQLIRSERIDIPPVFIDLLVQAILRNLLDGCDDAQLLRAAELMFRPQRVAIQEGQVLAADHAVVDQYSQNGGLGELGRLLRESRTAVRDATLVVMDAGNAAGYWERSERFHYVLDLTHELTQELSHGLSLRMTRARSGLKSLAQVLERWTRHFLGVAVKIEPLARVDDVAWRWHTGLDAESSAILNDLYQSRVVEPERMQRLISLFRLEFADAGCMQAEIAGKPVWLGLAMNAQGLVRLKPQNLLLNLPLAARP